MEPVDSYSDPQQALEDIRTMMSKSSRFLSLSGLSGIWAGSCALLASMVAYWRADIKPFSGVDYYTAFYRSSGDASQIEPFVVMVGIVTLLASLAGAVFFTTRKASKTGGSVWNTASRAMLWSMLIPLVSGGILILAHWYHGVYGFSAAIALIFYGLSLLAGGRYTLDEIKYLGYLEIVLGVLTAFFPDYGIETWTVGFGILHIVYGIIMYRKYEA